MILFWSSSNDHGGTLNERDVDSAIHSPPKVESRVSERRIYGRHVPSIEPYLTPEPDLVCNFTLLDYNQHSHCLIS